MLDQKRSRGKTPRSLRRHIALLVLLALLGTLVVRTFVLQSFVIPTESMDPTLAVNDRILVSRLSYRFGEVRRGDVIVFDGQDSFISAAAPESTLAKLGVFLGGLLGFSPREQDYTKRVIGLPGDRVVCCTASGRVSINGRELSEPYVPQGVAPSEQRFDIIVPPGRLWVMGDNRANSADSRAHIGDPGGGTVPQERVIGRVIGRFWPVGRLTMIKQLAAEQEDRRE
jgi:signal peptidase I